ncbi:uncharacterized protein LOC134837055 [Culicoides brevitarsis]|uniref:uncharacterized protein LOC134837055 n=1 Tax=Culicoides brevitarsis TaxID=469753 RepID=UPI00307CC3A2
MVNLFWRRTTVVVVILLLFGTVVVASDGSSDDKTNETDSSLNKTKRQASAIPAIETCKKLREECLRSCPTIKNCTEQCPICPTLTKVDPVIESEENNVINRNFIVQNGNGTEDRFSVKHLAGANYTTIIRLSNIINNTNIVKVPTVVNATNINNIKIFANSSAENDGPFGLGFNNKSEPCCFAIHPKTCRPSLDGGYRCHHRRHKMCSNQCKSRQMHVQARNRCVSEKGCQRKVAYVPEPRVTCSYVNYWPYVNCGGTKSRYSCAGCYDHYGYGFSAYYSRNDDIDCSGCYNDAFDYGPLYRRGPVLRPFYYHEPPCYISGRCPYSGYYQSEFGHFGHELVDPVFGPVYDDDNLESDDNNTISDWGVVLSKCKVVSDNETVSLENCTLAKENPFAAAPEILRSFVPPQLMDYEEMYSQYEPPKVNFNKRNRNSNKLTRRLKRKTKKNLT